MEKTKAYRTYSIHRSIAFKRVSSDELTPFELAVSMVEEIPDRLFNTNVLIPGSGFGTFALALIHKGWDPAKITMVEIDKGFSLLSQEVIDNKYGTTTVNQDFLTFSPGMKFDVLIGNPPYQRPKHSEGNKDNRPLWIDFLSKCGELLANGGHMSLLVPGQVVKTTRWTERGKGLKSLEWGNVTGIRTEVEKHFSVGTSIYQVTATTGRQGRETLINDEIKVDFTKQPWLPTEVTADSLSLVSKISSHDNNFRFKLCPSLDGIEDQSIGMYRMNQDYGYSVEITSKRRKTKANGEPLKLMWLNMDCESAEQAENLKRLMKSKLFTALRRLTFYEPNYSHLFINGMTYPNQIPHTDEEIYTAYGLTKSEIKFVEKFQK